MFAGAALALTACGEGHHNPLDNANDPPGPIPVVGVYSLRTYDGVALPYLWTDEDSLKIEITSGRLTLREDRTYSFNLRWRFTRETGVTFTNTPFDGVYSLHSRGITLREHPEVARDGEFSGVTKRTLTYFWTRTLVFRR
jgi:hypothetical protein